ncbi:hypothetical protein K1719_008995 [Acacia pycnantha]|nr:hypothetical protein K1719_008995 [Acacia pycnantha]
MLKVVTLTKDALGEFDWSSFILEELSQQIHKFNKDSHKSKATKRKTVGGCVYFLMLFCLQNFAFGDKVASEHESAMAYWTDDRVKSRAVMEKKSKTGLLARISRSQPSDTTSASFDPHTMLTHPPSSSGECEEDDDDRDEEDDDKEIDDEDDEKEIEDEDDDNDKEKDDQDYEKEIEDEDDEKDKEDEDDHIVDIDDEDSHLHDTPIVQHGLHVEPTEEYVVEEEVAQPQLQEGERSDGKIRRSKRVITRSSVLKSPWIDPNRKTKGKRRMMRRSSCMSCVLLNLSLKMRLRMAPPQGRATLSETTYVDKQYVMTMIAKTLVADQLDNGGTVTRHIFIRISWKNDRGSDELAIGSQ